MIQDAHPTTPILPCACWNPLFQMADNVLSCSPTRMAERKLLLLAAH